MRIIHAPKSFEEVFEPIILLAGSIEMGKAEQWQNALTDWATDTNLFTNVTFLNPRRPDGNSSWIQSKDNPPFAEQVNWELHGIQNADLIVFYFDPATKSPITLMELGLAIGLHKEVIICCPSGFWRKGNVDVLCERAGLEVLESFEQLKSRMKSFFLNRLDIFR
jgi:nucleoside 2-deoxyribosyltransferase